MFVADRTRLELATSGVTGRHSNQLNYRSTVESSRYKWWVMTGSNRRPSACKADALPAELITPKPRTRIIEILLACQTFREKLSEISQLKAVDFSSKIQLYGVRKRRYDRLDPPPSTR